MTTCDYSATIDVTIPTRVDLLVRMGHDPHNPVPATREHVEAMGLADPLELWETLRDWYDERVAYDVEDWQEAATAPIFEAVRSLLSGYVDADGLDEWMAGHDPDMNVAARRAELAARVAADQDDDPVGADVLAELAACRRVIVLLLRRLGIQDGGALHLTETELTTLEDGHTVRSAPAADGDGWDIGWSSPPTFSGKVAESG